MPAEGLRAAICLAMDAALVALCRNCGSLELRCMRAPRDIYLPFKAFLRENGMVLLVQQRSTDGGSHGPEDLSSELAGTRKVRNVMSPEHMLALPVGSVVLGEIGGAAKALGTINAFPDGSQRIRWQDGYSTVPLGIVRPFDEYIAAHIEVVADSDCHDIRNSQVRRK